MRRHEAVLLREHVENILESAPQTNLLLYGDFNDTKNEQPIKVIQGRFGDKNYLRDLWLQDADGYRFTYYWSFADSYDRIDFAFINDGLWPEVETKKSFLAKRPRLAQGERPSAAGDRGAARRKPRRGGGEAGPATAVELVPVQRCSADGGNRLR